MLQVQTLYDSYNSRLQIRSDYDQIRSDQIILYSSPEGNYGVAPSNTNSIKEYKSKHRRIKYNKLTLAHPWPTDTHTRTLNLMHTVKL